MAMTAKGRWLDLDSRQAYEAAEASKCDMCLSAAEIEVPDEDVPQAVVASIEPVIEWGGTLYNNGKRIELCRDCYEAGTDDKPYVCAACGKERLTPHEAEQQDGECSRCRKARHVEPFQE